MHRRGEDRSGALLLVAALVAAARAVKWLGAFGYSRYATDMSHREWSRLVQLVVIGLLLLGCGGRARGDKADSDGAAGAASVGAMGERNMGGGGVGGTGVSGTGTGGTGTGTSGGSNGGPAEVTIDDEVEGRPVAPSTAAIFWGSNTTGWRIGNWFLTTDTTRDVQLSPLEPPRGDSKEARHVRGDGQSRGAVLWLELDHPFGRAVSLGAYSGVTFWARLKSVTGVLVVSLNDGTHLSGSLADRATLPSVSLTLGDSWQQFTLPFDAFGLSDPRASTVEFFVGDAGEAYDLWIDDFALTCPGACP